MSSHGPLMVVSSPLYYQRTARSRFSQKLVPLTYSNWWFTTRWSTDTMLTLFQHRGGKCMLWSRCLQKWRNTETISQLYLQFNRVLRKSCLSAGKPCIWVQAGRHVMVRWGWLAGCHVTLGLKIKAVRVFVGCFFFRFFTDGGDHMQPILIGSSYMMPTFLQSQIWWTRIHHNMSEAVQEVTVQCAEDCFFFFCFDSFVHIFFCLLVNMKNSSAFCDINSLHTAGICNRVKTVWFDLFVSCSLFLWSLQSGRTTLLQAPVFNVYIYVHQ